MNTTWFHFIGKPKQFLPPAEHYGVSRRCPSSLARLMQFGDRVICLAWRGKLVPAAAFAEFRITTLYFDHDVKVFEKLAEQGRAEYEDYGGGGKLIVRECGDFIISGGYVLKPDVTIAEIFKLAEAENAQQGGKRGDLWCMIGGALTQVYQPPLTVDPPVKFSRGFSYVQPETRIGDEPIVEGSPATEVLIVKSYDKRMIE